MFGLWETTGTFSRLTLTEITDDDKVFVKNNPQLFDKEFYKKKTLIFKIFCLTFMTIWWFYMTIIL